MLAKLPKEAWHGGEIQRVRTSVIHLMRGEFYEEYQTAQANLERHGWAVEYIITHCCPTSVLDAIGRGMFQSDPLTDFLEEVAQRCRFRHWFFWHYHMDGHMGEQFIYLYQELLQIDADP